MMQRFYFLNTVSLIRGLVVCIIDHYPLGNQRTEISGGLNISEHLGRGSGLSDIAALPFCYCSTNPYISIIQALLFHILGGND